ncbi:AI-2E family transporter [Aeoliella sp.]|uniref:AI-2E family transporter n=1 Tax=Aeoliella sp. TaxID=2795800 RepID=UPI003CCBF380
MDTAKLERDSHIRTTAMVILTFIAVAVALYFLRPVLMPFVLALFIASGLVPLLSSVQKWLKSSRPMAIFATFLMSIAVTIVLWWMIAVSVQELVGAQGKYNEGFNLMLDRIGDLAEPLLPDGENLPKQEKTEVDPPPVTTDSPATEPGNPLDAQSESAASGDLNVIAPTDSEHASLKRLNDYLSSRLSSVILLGANELLTVLSSGLLVMIFLFFMLLGGSQVRLPENNIWRDVDAHVRKYIVAKTVISLITGFVFGMVLWLFGVPLAFVLGVLAFLLNFIPNLGPIISSLLPVPLVWVLVEATWADQPGADMGLVKAIVVIVLAASVQFISGNVFEPKIMGDQFRLHPIAILLSLMFWYMIWGLVGAFLAVPITSALKIVFAELESTRPAADLLEGNLTILAKRETTAATA